MQTLSHIIASALLLTCPALAQSTWYVDQSGGGDFTQIQDAFDSPLVQSGDTVLVRPGIYYENLSLGVKWLCVESTGGPAVTIVDAGGIYRALSITNVIGGEFEGLTFRNGAIQSADGGGVYVDSSTITMRRCSIVGCSAPHGGGVFASQSNLTLIDVDIEANSVSPSGEGGGLSAFGGELIATGLAPILGPPPMVHFQSNVRC